MNPSTEGLVPLAEDDPRLLQAVQEYLAELEAGRRPDRRTFVGRFPELARDLVPYLDALDMVQAAGPRLRLESGPRAVAAEALAPEALGDFKIVQEIGRGGMGVVYEAVQLSLGRRVALKVLPFAAALDAKQLRRFQNEAQAAAHLHHQNIVPVYFVGNERGVHFYAMQLIEGQNLAALIEGLRSQSRPTGGPGTAPRGSPASTGPHVTRAPAVPAVETRPRAHLSTHRSGQGTGSFRAAVELIAQAAEALDYAHGVGVIHRDIKPANLLVDGRGNVWVTDFGLAQFHADAALTQTGDLLGTLRYMSPEQAGGQRVLIDHRTDVYSLGATLYELLTLHPIFEGADRQTLLRQILHEEPKSPRSLDRAIPAELETVVLKAVAKTPAERYASAREFADDLQRFLRNEPILARRATLAQRARKWLIRHPSVPIAGAVLLLLLTVGSLLAAWLIGNEQEKTRQAYERERQRAQQAEERFHLASRYADRLIQLGEDILADNPQLRGVRKLLLEAALADYQEFIEQRRDDLDAQAALQATRDRVQKILDELTVLEGAGLILLLRDRAVLDDLKATPEQRERLRTADQQLEGQRREWFDRRRSSEEREQRFLKLVSAENTAIAQIFRKDQSRRLRQIALQGKGTGAFREPDVIAELKLTVAQRERIRSLEAEMWSPMGDCRPGQTKTNPAGKTPDEIRKALIDKILAVLTETQAKRWTKMTGEPFVRPAPEPRPGPRDEGPDRGRKGPRDRDNERKWPPQ